MIASRLSHDQTDACLQCGEHADIMLTVGVCVFALCTPHVLALQDHVEAFHPHECIDCGATLLPKERQQAFRTCKRCARERREAR
jgi:hypothetical protein